MPSTADFTLDPVNFASNYAILVVEPPGLVGAALVGQNNIIPPMVMNADFTVAGGAMANTVVCNILAAAVGTSVPCYFLPYLPNGATTMTIGGGANYFFTSMMTGCTVQAYGPANAPTITHSNAANTFNSSAGDLATATNAAQIAINNMLPAVAPGQAGASVTRLTMDAAFTPGNMAVAKAHYPVDPNYRIKELDPKMVNSKGTDRPETGMFTFGIRVGGNWAFYASVSTSVVGRQKTGKTYFGFINSGVTNKTIRDDAVVLGAATRFWP